MKFIKNVKKIFFFLLIFLILFFLYFFTSKNCRTYKIFFAVSDLGFNQLADCYSLYKLKEEIKFFLKNNEIFFNIAKGIYHSNILYEDLNNFDISSNDKKINFERNNQTIIGVINNSSFNNQLDINFPKIEEGGDTWLRSHGGNYNHKYNVANFIDKKNISHLKLVWKHTSINQDNLYKYWKGNIELNPIFINEKIIFITPDWKIIALEGDTGKKIWSLQSLHRPSVRGIVSEYEVATKREVIFLPVDNKIYKIDAKNGKRINQFGKNGYIFSSTIIAPIIYKDYLISVNIKGSIDIFNKFDGKFFSSIPIHSKKNFTGGNPWGGAAFDDKKGIVFVNTGNPHPSTYGVNRPGDNKNSASVIAIDVNKQKVIWSFQETSHDLWDFDIPSPPIIHNLKIGKDIYEVVISLSKIGNTIILERNTGLPIFDVFFEKVPQSDIPGEIVSNYQIKINKPEPFSDTIYGEKDFKYLSDDKKVEINKIFKYAKTGWYEPPSLNQDLIIFGIHGGAEWQGGALDPVNQDLYIPVNRVPWIVRPRLQSKEIITKNFPENLKSAHNLYINQCASCHGKYRNGVSIQDRTKMVKYVPSLVGFFSDKKLEYKFSYNKILNKHNNIILSEKDFFNLKDLFKYWDNVLISNKEIIVDAAVGSWHQFLTSDGLPAQDPPYGYLAKLNLSEGKIMWRSPIGYQKVHGKDLRHGSTNFGGVAVNGSGIIFYTGTDDSRAYAIDSLDGKELWSFEMEAAGSAPPILYNIKGRQYVSFLSTGGAYHNYKKRGSTIYTFSLEK